MLIAAKDMYSAPMEGSDGHVGTLHDLLFDDRSWKLRHMVVNTDRWFLGQQVLLDPEVFDPVDWPERLLRVRLTKEQVRQSPGVETDLPVARRESLDAAQMLIWEAYWTNVSQPPTEMTSDSHLRSMRALTGLHIHCTDGPLGHVEDFLIDSRTWSLAELVVDTRNWWPGKRVLVEPSLVESILWEEREFRLSLPRGQVEDRPAFQYEKPTSETFVGSF